MKFGIYPGGRAGTTCSSPPDVVASLGAEHDLARLTMPDEWYVEGGRELHLVVSYIPRKPTSRAGWPSSTRSSTSGNP